MILVLLNYTADIAAVDAVLAPHREWLEQSIADNILLAAGRKVPRTGGMLLAQGDMATVKAWAATDPFAIAGVADYQFIEVTTSMVAPGLEALIG